MVKVWKIWDLRTKKRYIWPDSGEKFFVDGKPFNVLPFADLRFHERMNKWYPVPPIFNWISPQDELNETREMQRVHRKRMYRRYLKSPSITDEQMGELEDGGDGAYIEGKDGDIVPVPDAPLDRAIDLNVPQTREDFREITGVSGDQRGVTDTETATQANIVESRAQIREDFGRTQVANYLAQIASIALLTIRENMALPIWVKTSVDPFSPAIADETARVVGLWTQIQAEELGDYNFDVMVDVASLSPLGEEQKRNKFFQGLAVLGNPQFSGLLLGSDILLRKALQYFDIVTEREIQEVKKALMMNMMMQAKAAAAQAGGTAGGQDGIPRAPGNGPDASQLAMQVAKQASGGVVQ